MHIRKRTKGKRRSDVKKEYPKLGNRVNEQISDQSRNIAQAMHTGTTDITLHPDLNPVVTQVPSYRDWVTVPLRNHNSLPAFINGHSCLLYVDCGTTSAMIAHRIADKLGLLEKVTVTKDYELQLWTTKVRHKLKIVEDVLIQLSGGVELCCTFLVLPEEMVTALPGILLDNSTLRQAGAVQQFTDSACVLYFPSRNPARSYKSGGDSQYIIDATLKRSLFRSKKMNIHVDTGATYFYVSPRCLYTRLNLTELPKNVSLILAKGVAVYSDLVRLAGTDTFDFVLGKEMLSRYKCVLDFASDSLYFHVKEKVFCVKLRKSRTV